MSNAGAATPFPIRFADIIFADGVLDPNGQNPKCLRVVILTPDAELAAGWPIVAAAVTATLPPGLTTHHIELPYRSPPAARHPKTGLTKRAAVLGTWLVRVDPGDVTGRSGFVPSGKMTLVNSKTAATARVLGGWP